MGIELNSDQIFASYKAKDWWTSVDSKQVFEISGKGGTGKMEPDDTLIPTPSGIRMLKDLKIGDYVFDRHGFATRILGVFPQGEKTVYRVMFNDGREVTCGKEHLWTFFDEDGNFQTKSLEYFIENSLYDTDDNGKKHYKFAIPINGCVNYGKRVQDNNPYVLGVLLGCGTNSSKICIETNNDAVVNEIRYKLCAANVIMDKYNHNLWSFESMSKKGVLKPITDKDIFKIDKSANYRSNRRRIPENYMFATSKQRLDLLKGIFDSIGRIVITKENNAELICETADILLLRDIKRVISSLGFSSYIRYEKSGNNETKDKIFCLSVIAPYYMYQYFFKHYPFKTIANTEELSQDTREFDRLYIIDIKKLPNKTPCRCIYVNNDEHLYLTDEYIVTHNTTCIKYIIQDIGLDMFKDVLFVAFTGKAASQLSRNGIPAQSCHSAFYEYVKEYDRDEDGRKIILPNGKAKMKGVFRLKERLKKRYKLIVIDEATMINEAMKNDIESFGIPIIAMGDLNQLPPVFGSPVFLKEPDVILRKIMRQAEGDPIIYIANRILDGYDLRPGVFGNSAIIKKTDLTEYQLRSADIILTGTNSLRMHINKMFREEYLDFGRLDIPHIGEKVVCVKNNWSKSIGNNLFLTNGTTGFLEYVNRESYNGKSIICDFRPDFTSKMFRDLTVDYKHLMTLEKSELQQSLSFGMDSFEFAYAITVHKSQGSQWENVVALADLFGDSMMRRSLLYTMVSRASKSITLVI